MAEQRTDTESRTDGRRRWVRCLGRLAFTAPMALVCLQLALGGLPQSAVPVLLAALWLWLAISVTARIVGFVRGVNRTDDPWRYFRNVPSACAWASLLLLAVSAGALFAAGEPTLAGTMEVVLLLRLAVLIGAGKPARARKGEEEVPADSPAIVGGAEALGVVIVASALWLALGAPPIWAESMIVTTFWIYALIMIVGACLQAAAFTFGPGVQKRALQSDLRQDMSGSWPESPTTPEPARTWRRQLTMWLWRAGLIVVAWALWTAGYPLLAGLCILGPLLLLSADVRERRQKHSDSARIDFLSRAVHFIVWWPLVAAGTVCAAAILAPLGILGAIYERIVGTLRHPLPESEREARAHEARIRRAAASYRLREAFGKPEGFVYFMCSEPHQREHFLGDGGLLAALGDRVVARDYRRHVMETRTTYNWQAFELAPEGALLRLNGVSNMRRDLPFIAVVPPRGRVQIFRLSKPYRARTRDRGAALEQAEAELRVAIDAAFHAARGN